jgi:hypothetical protein
MENNAADSKGIEQLVQHLEDFCLQFRAMKMLLKDLPKTEGGLGWIHDIQTTCQSPYPYQDNKTAFDAIRKTLQSSPDATLAIAEAIKVMDELAV